MCAKQYSNELQKLMNQVSANGRDFITESLLGARSFNALKERFGREQNPSCLADMCHFFPKETNRELNVVDEKFRGNITKMQKAILKEFPLERAQTKALFDCSTVLDNPFKLDFLKRTVEKLIADGLNNVKLLNAYSYGVAMPFCECKNFILLSSTDNDEISSY